jgi:hypothetical protein
VRRAVDWVEKRQPDLAQISGDLSRRRGEPRLHEVLVWLPNCYAVLGKSCLGDYEGSVRAGDRAFDLDSTG